ncbi:hypothetical protein SADO_09819 [Salinisphaera dokdonensis CL-ES53]|uniref:TRAP transporter small permease protein n=1 Tax=Salinisphaera dokdonensis CL-ES53 TaxID=1304272 RepID=A0ABV2B2B0_9GAMM
MEPSGAGAIGRALDRLCLAMAVAGGVVICLLAGMTVCSILGRWSSGIAWLASVPVVGDFGPIMGDFEMTKMGTAMAVFLFLPYCHMRGGHVTVDLLMSHAPRVLRRVVAALSEILFLVVSALMTWRLVLGMQQKLRYEQTTMLMEIPVWWGYGVGIVGLSILTLVCLYRALAVCRGQDVHA